MMPRISDDLRARRREHILTSAWSCFARDGFHATSMDDVIAATGMSSSAVYRYFRSKEELIDAAADEALMMTRDLFRRLLAAHPTPSPAQTIAALADELRRRAAHPEYDLFRIVMQTLMPGLVVLDHLVGDVSADDLAAGLAALGASRPDGGVTDAVTRKG
jgi:AcrR family transcriptional regulator